MTRQRVAVGGFLGLVSLPLVVNAATDISFRNVTLSNLAFGSCHKRKYAEQEDATKNIWTAIQSSPLDAFLWTGDAVYPPTRKIASVQQLKEEYQHLLEDTKYQELVASTATGVFGTWDDHDYGGNDLGVEMTSKRQRRDAFFDFLGYHFTSEAMKHRQGVYHSVEWGESPRKVKALLLDTRWHRDQHCIPSVASSVPLGAGISCLTRWLTAGMNWCIEEESTLLGDVQWKWLQDELLESDAQFFVIVSSVQVLTTNPVMESWGHFPRERGRLLKLVNQAILPKSKERQGTTASVILLSGDVHHAELLDPLAASLRTGTVSGTTRKESFLEITSSGLTHTCTKPFYGAVCEPLLKTFDAHRLRPDSYYVGRNFGGLEVDWERRRWRVQVYNAEASPVLSTNWRDLAMEPLTNDELERVAPCVDGHLRPYIQRIIVVVVSLVVFVGVVAVVWTKKIWFPQKLKGQ